LLASIDKFLGIVSELMEKEPAIERQAFDHLKQLRTRIRFAIAADPSEDGSSSIPSHAPATWLARKDRSESPVDFIRREYGPWLGQGISRPDIKRLDKSLYDALCNWLSKHGPMPNDVDLPTKKEMNDRKLQEAGVLRAPSRSRSVAELTPDEREKLRLYELARGRRRRQN
jgi:hypothetical protein